jgi:hypothetical protein
VADFSIDRTLCLRHSTDAGVALLKLLVGMPGQPIDKLLPGCAHAILFNAIKRKPQKDIAAYTEVIIFNSQ